MMPVAIMPKFYEMDRSRGDTNIDLCIYIFFSLAGKRI